MLIPRELHALRTQAAAAQHACHVAVAAYHAAATTRTPTRLLRDQALSCRAAGDQSALTLLGDYLDQGAAEPNPSMERAQVQHGLDLVYQQLNRRRRPGPCDTCRCIQQRRRGCHTPRRAAIVLPTLRFADRARNTRRRPSASQAAQRPQGGALTQRWETTTRSTCVGKLLADLPSGARSCSSAPA